MKKSIFTLLAILMIASGVAHATQGTDGNVATKRETGAPGYVPYREYQLVRYGAQSVNDTSLTAGDVVTWDCASDDGVTIGLVGVINSVDSVAGVVVSTVIQTAEAASLTPGLDYGRRNWGWIQVKGYTSTINIVDGPGAAGGSIMASGTARNATNSIGAANGTRRLMGFAYDAWTGAGGATDEAQIDL